MANSKIELPKPEQAGGFELYLPPTPFPKDGETPRFVMLDDQEQAFYDVFYGNPLLRNTKPWSSLEMHKLLDPAIVIGPKQLERLNQDPKELERLNQGYPLATGHLVNIVSRSNSVFTAELLAAVNIVPLQEEVMNWSVLKTWKGVEIVTELQNGLLRRVWNRRTFAPTEMVTFSTQASTLNEMPRPWHDDGTYLNYELDQRFMGACKINPDQVWQFVPQGWKAS